MQRSEGWRLLSLVTTTAFAVAGAVLIAATRHERSPRSARLAFIGASLLWWWSATMFYGGWGVSPDSLPAGPHGSFALALQAIDSTLAIDLVTVATIAAVAAAVWRTRNRVALWTLLAFWGTLQTAKLNVFFGVRSPGIQFLPPELSGLRIFFGPERNSPFLAVTIVAIALVALLLWARARRSRDAFVRHGSAMLASLPALAAVEHLFLGLSASLPLWDFFLRVRGQ
jgi:putative photosynthetic complex assembly protein 2